MKAQHTPGPWQIQRGVPIGFGLVASAGLRQKIVSAEGVSDSEADANARLIAAAPDLLAALQAIEDDLSGVISVAAIDGQIERLPSLKAARDLARAAIAKAKGHQ